MVSVKNLILLTVILFSLVACKKTVTQNSNSSIVGKWRLSEYLADPGDGSGTWHSEASVETGLSIAEVESHFAKQLEHAGWTRLSGSADDIVGWSSWQVPGEGDWRGLFLVLGAFKPGEPFLYLRIEAGESHEGGWYSSGTMAFRR